MNFFYTQKFERDMEYAIMGLLIAIASVWTIRVALWNRYAPQDTRVLGTTHPTSK